MHLVLHVINVVVVVAPGSVVVVVGGNVVVVGHVPQLEPSQHCPLGQQRLLSQLFDEHSAPHSQTVVSP